MSDIFICYSRTDGAIATKLAERLRAEGWSVFMDLHIDAGHRWAEEIQSELATARAVLTLWSSSSLRSRFVMDEAHDAAERGIIVPARIEEVPIPYGFRQFQTPNLIGWDGRGDREEWQRIVATLRKHLNDSKSPGSTPESSLAPGQTFRDKSPPKPVAPRPLAPGQTFCDKLKVSGEGPLMVVIPAGRFVMGSPPDEPGQSGNEGPQHEVRIAKPFALGVYAVTFDDYDRYCDATKQAKPEDRGWGRGNRPVINVTWNDARAYCAWLSEQTGWTYRLPSEAEWEYACRAGTTTPFHFGARISTDQANFDGNSTYNGSTKGQYRKQTMPVGTFSPNPFGLYDMHGNIWEWCQDAWHDNYNDAPTDGSIWQTGGTVARVVRGGS